MQSISGASRACAPCRVVPRHHSTTHLTKRRDNASCRAKLREDDMSGELTASVGVIGDLHLKEGFMKAFHDARKHIEVSSQKLFEYFEYYSQKLLLRVDIKHGCNSTESGCVGTPGTQP